MKPRYMSEKRYQASTPRTFVRMTGDRIIHVPRPVYVVPRPGVKSTPVTLFQAVMRGAL